jgi:diguanylate cyclase (GGDEF)-like protein
VVTRDVVRWPWWATAALALLVLAWWRSHRRARALADSSDVLARRQRHMAATQRHLRERADQLQKTAVNDALTGTLTRQAFAGALDAAIAHARHFGQPVALVMFDLDHFKQVNDTLGHAAGDAALKLVAGIVREKLTSNDLFGRFGGDEFLVGLIGNDGPDALRVADAIRASLARHVQDGRAPTRQLGLSLGVAIADPDWGYDVDALFERADAALYAAKRGGRNRAVLADRAVAEQDAPDRAAAHAPRTLAR